MSKSFLTPVSVSVSTPRTESLADESDYQESDRDSPTPNVDEPPELSIPPNLPSSWLVKLPAYLAEKWATISTPGTELGMLKIVTEVEPSGKTTRSAKLYVPKIKYPALYRELPDDPACNVTIRDVDVQNTFIFEEPDHQGYGTRIVSKVVHDCSVQMVTMDAAYAQVQRARMEQTSKKRKVMLINEQDIRPTHMDFKWQQQPKSFDNPKKQRVTAETKNIRMKKEDLILLIIQLYERHEYFTRKALIKHTKQPEAYIKEVAREVLEFVKTGPYHGTYRLRPEYRREKSAQDGSVERENEVAINSVDLDGEDEVDYGQGESDDDGLDFD